MKVRKFAGLVAGVLWSLALTGSPAGAGSPEWPEISDPAGDANFVNGNGVVAGVSAQTTPASIDGADFRAIWFSTDYDTVKETDAAGNVTAVRYIPTALLLNIKTQAAPRPTFGPTLIYRVQANIAGCEVWFQGWVKGPASAPVDFERSDIRKLTSSCPGGAATITHAAFSMSSQGDVLTLRYPFSALPYSFNQIILAPDVEIRPQPGSIPHVRTVGAATLTAPTIDETQALNRKFRIGSDVPADVDCIATPTHPACAS